MQQHHSGKMKCVVFPLPTVHILHLMTGVAVILNELSVMKKWHTDMLLMFIIEFGNTCTTVMYR